MIALQLLPVVLSLVVLGAHFLRAGDKVMVGALLAVLALLPVRRRWAARTVQVVLVLGAAEWVRTLARLVAERESAAKPVVRLSLILGGVALTTALSALVYRSARLRSWYAPALVIALLASSACAGRRPPDVDDARDLSGVVHYDVVRDPNARPVQIEAHQDYTPPAPSPDNSAPDYPGDLLRLALPPRTVVVRAVIDERGDVVTVVRSPLAPAVGAPYDARFEEAAIAAVGRWEFEPARVRSFRPSDDRDGDGRPDYEILDGESPKKVFLDFRFVFEVREGKGLVRQMTNPGETP
ncbi:MAG: hypothetical protein HY049_14595 [Acidobacteria bacterium]|nr:hypothetical protein [Acidobacteriota bacterium]